MTCDLLQKIELIYAAGTQFIPPNAREVVRTFMPFIGAEWRVGLQFL